MRKQTFLFIFPGPRSDEKGDVTTNKSTEKKFHEEHEEEEETGERSAPSSHKQEKEKVEERGTEMKRGSRKSPERWTKRGKSLMLKKEADQQEAREVPHHSKDVTDEEDEEKEEKRDSLKSPEEKELQMIARRAPEERRVLEEEGSASRKSEVCFLIHLSP